MLIDVQPLRQEGVQMYSGVLTAGELLQVAKVDFWREEDSKASGYQRPLDPRRSLAVARYLEKDSQPLLPTSVLLSYRGVLPVSKRVDGVTTQVELPEGETLWIVDGQHRLEGLRKAIEELGITRYRDYPVPITVVEFPNTADEARQFRVINETMKKVDTGLARRLLAQLRAGADIGERKRIRDEYGSRKWEMDAVDIIRSLNQDHDSPWRGKIAAPTLKRQPGQIKELSFQTSLKPLLTTPPYRMYQPDRLARLLKAYWTAWQNVLPEAFEDVEEYVLLKTPGLFSLHQVVVYLLEVFRVRNIMTPTVEDFQDAIGTLGRLKEPDWWAKNNREGAALAGSMKGFALLAEEIIEALDVAGYNTGE